jgi:hypothetical protein
VDVVPVDRLERDWRHQLASPALAARLRTWQEQHAQLRAFGDPAALVRYLRRSLPGERQDAVLCALLSSARADPVAGRLVLQAMLPALKRLSSWVLVDTREQAELWSALLAGMWECVCGYPLERRPRRVAANLRLDTLHRVTKAHRRRTLERDMLALVAAAPRARQPAGGCDVEQPVRAAIGVGALTGGEAELILATRIDGVSLAALAAAEGVPYDALRMRRQRAERRLLLSMGVSGVVRSGRSKRLLDGARVTGAATQGAAGGSASDIQGR